MTEPLAKKAAERAWKRYLESMAPEVRACLTPADEAEWIKVKAEYFLAKGKPVAVSAPFDAPQFARDFISLASKTMRTSRLRVMCRGPVLDKHGAPRISKTTKREIIGWVPHTR
jgi:hypothetical protein